jgi:hypothetical protein
MSATKTTSASVIAVSTGSCSTAVQPFQQPGRVADFFRSYRQVYPVSGDVPCAAAEQFQDWVTEQSDRWNAPIVEAPKGRRDEFVEPASGVPSRIMPSSSSKPVTRHAHDGNRRLTRTKFELGSLLLDTSLQRLR